MSSDLQSILGLIQLNNYVSVAMVTAVTYDYLLTISSEIEYVWHRHWTWVSTLFVLVRYVGLCWAILSGLVGSTFVPGPLLVMKGHEYSKGTALYLVIFWGFPIFLAAADLVMILRVYAMWNRSKWILSVLLFIYVPQVIISFVLAGIYYNPNTTLSVTIAQVLDLSFCNGLSQIPPALQLGVSIPRFVLGVALLVLAVIPTLKQSTEMYKATRMWQSNKNMQKLTGDGILYFLVMTLFNTHDMIIDGSTINATSTIFLGLFSYIAICTMMPRFITSVRKLYTREVHRSWQNVDSGFGLLSSTKNATVSAIAFTDFTSGQSQITEGDDEAEAIPLKVLADNAHRV